MSGIGAQCPQLIYWMGRGQLSVFTTRDVVAITEENVHEQ